MVNEPSNPLQYRPVTRRYRTEGQTGRRICAMFGLVLCLPLIWGLESVKYAPYRPPQDMNPFWDESVRDVLTVMQIACGVMGWSVWTVYRWARPKG